MKGERPYQGRRCESRFWVFVEVVEVVQGMQRPMSQLRSNLRRPYPAKQGGRIYIFIPYLLSGWVHVLIVALGPPHLTSSSHHLLIDQSIDPSIHRCTHPTKSISQSINQTIKQSNNQSILSSKQSSIRPGCAILRQAFVTVCCRILWDTILGFFGIHGCG